MITLLRHDERLQVPQDQDQTEVWQTFDPQSAREHTLHGLGTLTNIHELRIPPGGSTTACPWEEAEILTYAYRGAFVHEDSTGSACVLRAGEFQVMSTGRRVRQKETNASGTGWAHILRLSLRPCREEIDYAHEQQRFTSAQRRNKLFVVASTKERNGALRLHQDALILSSELEPGHHLVHELRPGRSAWLHIIRGEATLGRTTLTSGDGVGFTGEPKVSLTARAHTELLLVEVRTPAAP